MATPRLALWLGAALVATGLAGTPARALDPAPSATVTSSSASLIEGVKLTYPGLANLEITVDRVAIEGADTSDPARFRASKVTVSGLALNYTLGTRDTMRFDTVTLSNVDAPMPSLEALARSAGPGTLPAALGFAFALSASEIVIPELSSTSPGDGHTAGPSTLAYTNFRLNDVRAGVAGTATIDSIRFAVEAAGDTPGFSLSTGAYAGERLDYNPLLAWLDDDRAAAAPDMARPLESRSSIRDIRLAWEGGDLTIASLDSSDFRMGRPLQRPSDLAVILEKTSNDPAYFEKAPAELAGFLQSFLRVFEIGSLQFNGVRLTQGGEEILSLDLARLEAASFTKFAELRLGGLSALVPDQPDEPGGRIEVGSLSLTGFELADLDPFLTEVLKGSDPGALPINLYPKPRLGGGAVTDASVAVNGMGTITLGSFTYDARNWLGFWPTDLRLAVRNFVVPAGFAEDAATAAMVKEATGSDAIDVSAEAALAWNSETSLLDVGPFAFEWAGVGHTRATARIGGVPSSLFTDPDMAAQAIGVLDFRGLEIGVENKGALGPILDNAAREEGKTRADLANELAGQAQGAITAFLNLPEAGVQVGDAVRAFFADPKSLRIAIGAKEPIPAIALMGAADGSMEALDVIKQLVTITADANK